MSSLVYNTLKNIEENLKILKQISLQDDEWASDWQVIVSIFATIDKLEKQFKQLDVNYLREIQQKILILNLQKYAYSLQEYIIEKYSRE